MEIRSENDIRSLPPLLQEHVRQVLRAGGRVWFGRDGEPAPPDPVKGGDPRAGAPAKP